MTSYTTQNLAKQFKVSTQTVRNISKKLDIEPTKDSESRSFIFSKEQAEQLAEYFDRKLEDDTESESELIKEYREEIAFLKEQIALKDEQIANRDNQISALITTNQALSASNAVQVASDKKELLLVEDAKDSEPESKKGFWKRLFG